MVDPVVVLHPSQTHVEISKETGRKAVEAAYRMTLSPHEWMWTQAEVEAMAQFVLFAHQQISAIQQISTSTSGIPHAPAT